MSGDALGAAVSLYRAELPLSARSAFLTHGVATWGVLFGGWLLFCSLIEFSAAKFPRVSQSKLQSAQRTDDPRLRALARKVVTRNWLSVLLQAIVFAPLLKVAFPLHQVATAMTLRGYASFFGFWLVSNDLLFTLFHAAFHEVPGMYRFHKEHHTWKAPFCWMSHAMSLTEASANGIAVMAYPLFHSLYLGRTTPLELVWFVQLVAELIGCIEHSGYDALHPLLIINPAHFPHWLFSTTKKHDDHHRCFNGNYGGYLNLWDVLAGTVIEPGARSQTPKRE
jgi:sterol desaturase/sphingolipid hydroxylase (fatty acid hydroxylase superfamily)